MKLNLPDFTVLMAVYAKDNPVLFRKALSSTFNNSLKPNSLILVCDGPLNPDLEQIVQDFFNLYADTFNVVRLEKNSGLAAALNFGLLHVKTEWVIRADSDDINHKDRFRSLMSYVEKNKNLAVLGSSIEEISLNHETIAIKTVPLEYSSICKYALKRNPFNHMSVAFRRSIVMEVGGYPDIYLKEDYALWVKIIATGFACENIPQILVSATTGIEMYQRRGGWKYAMSEIPLQRLFILLGIKSRLRATLDGFLRAFVYVMPNNLRKFIYLSYLRGKRIG